MAGTSWERRSEPEAADVPPGEIAFQQAPDAVLVADCEGWIVLANRRAGDLLGYDPTEIQGTNLGRVIPGIGDALALLTTLTDTADFRTQLDAMGPVHWAQTRDGSRVPVDVSFEAIESAGAPLALASLRDVTGRQRNCVEPMHPEHIHHLVQSAGDPIVGLATTGEILTWNPAAERFFGHAADDAIGSDVAGLVAEPERRCLLDALDQARFGGYPRPVEVDTLRSDGTVVPASVAVSPIEDHRGAVVGSSMVVRDVSDLRRRQGTLFSLADHRLALIQMAIDAHASPTTEAMLDGFCRRIQTRLDAPACVVLEHDPDADALVLRARAGPLELVEPGPFPVDPATQIGFTLRSNRRLVIENLDREPALASQGLPFETASVSGITDVIPGRSRPWGVLGVFAPHKQDIAEAEVEMVDLAGDLIGTAIGGSVWSRAGG